MLQILNNFCVAFIFLNLNNVGVQCAAPNGAIDFKILNKMAQLLEQENKLTPQLIEPNSETKINLMLILAVQEYVEYCKKTFLKNGNLQISSWPIDVKMSDTHSFIKGGFTDLQVQNVGNLQFYNITADLLNLISKYSIYFEKDLITTGKYKIEGQFLGQNIYGQGSFEIVIKGMKCSGITGATVSNKHIKINSMESSFNMDDIKINITNLTVDQFTEEELHTLINSAALIYVKQYQDFLSKLGAPIVIEYLNKKIENFTITELYSLVTMAIKSTNPNL